MCWKRFISGVFSLLVPGSPPMPFPNFYLVNSSIINKFFLFIFYPEFVGEHDIIEQEYIQRATTETIIFKLVMLLFHTAIINYVL